MTRTKLSGGALLGVALLMILPVAAGGCGKAARPASPPPVILISVDTLRADHLPAYGYRRVETPAIDALARDAVRFENAYCQVPLTLPSHAVLLTGLLPYQNGVRDNIGFRLAGKTPTLASLLRDAGYAAGAAVSSFALRADRGLASGFDFYDDRFPPESSDERPGTETVEKLTHWMETVAGRPVFAFLHLYEPHAPYAPPEPYRTRYASLPYDGEIAAADLAVGRFFDFLKSRGLYDRAVIVFLSDHGEGLGDHGEQEHGVFLYREAIRVPLLLKLPGKTRRGEVIAGPVGLIDLLPTLMRLAGIAAAPGLRGADLLAPSSSAAARRIYSETLYPRLALGWSDLACLTDGRYAYIEAPRPELYDLLADPMERHNLAPSAPEAFRSMRAALAALARPEAAPRASAEELQKLGSLGYVSVSRGASPSRSLPDPKDKVETLARYKRLFDLFYAKRDREAIAAAQELLAEDRAIASVWRILARCRERLGDPRGAARDLERGIAECPMATAEELSQTYEQLVQVLERSGERSGAEKALKEAAAKGLATDAMKVELARLLSEQGRPAEALAQLPEGSPDDDAAVWDARGVVLAQAGRIVEARQALERALGRDPAHAPTLEHLGTLSLREKDAASAKKWFEKALAIEPGRASAWTGLGLAQAALGDEKGAYDSWSRAIAADSRQFDALYNRAILAGRLGRPLEARGDLERFVKTAPPGPYAEKVAQARRLLKALRATGS